MMDDNKKVAQMLFKMHLKKKKEEPTESELLARYNSPHFREKLMYGGALNMSEEQRIAWAYPEHEIVMHVDGLLVYFETPGGTELQATVVEATNVADELRWIKSAQWWEECKDIFVPNGRAWVRPL